MATLRQLATACRRANQALPSLVRPGLLSSSPRTFGPFIRTYIQGTSDDIAISDSCANKLNRVNEKKGYDPPRALRVSVDSGGCGGYTYEFKLVDPTFDDHDVVFEKDGAKVVCDDISLDYLRGSTIDFQKALVKAAFTITDNPNATNGCGCGVSFTLKDDGFSAF